MSCYTESPEGVIVNVRAQPRSSRSGVDGVVADALKVRLRAAPVDGKANKELVETVADAFGLPKSRVKFKSGETSKTKRMVLCGVSGAEFETMLKDTEGK
jgi:uncharacterized protein (TIGR00251 family)